MTKGWRNHPAVLMWEGHELSLIEYGQAICQEWIERGFNDTLLIKIGDMATCFPDSKSCDPEWLGDERLHLSHKSNLLRKDNIYYGKYFREIPSDLPYYWVTRKPMAAEKNQEHKSKRV